MRVPWLIETSSPRPQVTRGAHASMAPVAVRKTAADYADKPGPRQAATVPRSPQR